MARNCVRTAALVLFLLPSLAGAAQRTFVSAGSGNDANPCTRSLPCRGFAAAISQTDPGGEVVVIDTGGYGPVAIGQSVSLIAPPGVHAAITAFSGNAIDIAAGPTDVVILRGLYLSGLGGVQGIDFTTGQTLHVEECVVSGFSAVGVYGRANGARVYVLDTVSRQNFYGFVFQATASIVASLDSVRAEESFEVGVWASSNSRLTVSHSLAAGREGIGFWANDSAALSLESCTATMNFTGVVAEGTVRVRNSMIAGNIQGLFAADGGTILSFGTMISGNTTGIVTAAGGSTISFGNNGLHGNGTDGSFTTTVAQQ